MSHKYSLKSTSVLYIKVSYGRIYLGLAEKDKLKKERAERNHIEGKFGQGKTKYKLNKIMARLPKTAESWIANIIFVMNILWLSQDIFCAFFVWLYQTLFYPINAEMQRKSAFYRTQQMAYG